MPARLSPPRLAHTLPRERLFAWLDAQRGCAAIWLNGAPGAGKTILAASYLHARSLRGLWYRLDADDRGSTCCWSARERLRGKFNRLVASYGAALQRAGRWEEALAVYRRGIEADDLAEEFYQGVMHCALQLQRPAQGVAAYQRRQRVLSLVLGVGPSARSQALYRALLGH